MRYEEFHWDDPLAFYDTPAKKVVRMLFVLTGMAGLNRGQRLVRSQDIVDHLTGNPGFLTPNPTLAATQADIDDASAKSVAAAVANTNARNAAQAFREAMDKLDNDIVRLARYVENVGNDDEALILSSGFLIRPPAGPSVLPAAPGNVRVTAGAFTGQLVVRFDTVEGAVMYFIQTSATPTDPDSWVERARSTRGLVNLEGLPVGGECFVRVAGGGAAGQGPWSDVAVKRVP